MSLELDLQEEIDAWGEKLITQVVQKPDMPGMMYVEFEPPRIEGPTLDSKKRYPSIESCYLVMLHEFGHVVHSHTQGRPPYGDKDWYFKNGVLRSEAEAWEWALDHAEIDFGMVERDFMWNTCLGSYYSASRAAAGRSGQRMYGPGDRAYVSFTYDEPTDFFWSIKERILNGN